MGRAGGRREPAAFTAPRRTGDGEPDDTGCTVLHVDMDAFYASASLIDRPELRGQPVIIGGGGRSVVLSATYEARRYGVTSAMPMSRARRLCPQAVVIQPDFTRYAQVSDAIMATFHAVTDLVEPLSLDEAFLEVPGARRRLGRPTRIAQQVRDAIADEQGITCSVGVASTKFVAKLASGLAKPDGMIVVPRAEVLGFLHQLPVGALWGVGERTEEVLQRLGLRTVADIAHTPVETLRRRSVTAPAATCTSSPGDATSGRSCVSSGRRASAPTRPSGTTSTTPSSSTASCCASATARPPGCGRPVSSGAPSCSRCASPTSPPSPARAPCATPPTSRATSTPPPAPSSTPSACSGPGSGWSGSGWRGSPRRAGAPIQATLDEPDFGWRDADRAIDRASARFGAGAVRPAALVREPGSGPGRSRTAGRRAGSAAGPARPGPPDAATGLRRREGVVRDNFEALSRSPYPRMTVSEERHAHHGPGEPCRPVIRAYR